MPAARLFDMAMKRCIRGAAEIDDVGDLPYTIVKPILKQVKNAAQLAALEKNSPHLIGETAGLWRDFIVRDIPKKLRDEYDYEPRDPKNWYNVWKKLKRQADKRARETAEATIKNLKALKEDKEENVMAEMKGVWLPNRRGTTTAPPRPGGSTLLSNLRREAQKKKGPVKVPTRWGGAAPRTVVTHAPMSMLENHNATKEIQARTQAITRPQTLRGPPPRSAPVARRPTPQVQTRPAPRRMQPSSTVRPTPAATPTPARNLDVVERRRLSEAEFANIKHDGASASTAPSRKRPAPASSKPSPANFLVQPKRRKIG